MSNQKKKDSKSKSNDYVIMTGNSMVLSIEKPKRVKKIPDTGCSKSERDEWINCKSNKLNNEIKKQKQLEAEKEKNAQLGRRKELNEYLFYYGLYDDNYSPCSSIKDLPEKCLECGSPEYYKKSHVDDIKLICGVCNRPAFTLPGHGFDWKGNKIHTFLSPPSEMKSAQKEKL